MGVTGAALGTRTLWRAVRRRTRFRLRAAAECVIRGTEGRETSRDSDEYLLHFPYMPYQSLYVSYTLLISPHALPVQS